MTAELHIKSSAGDTPVLVGPGLVGQAGTILAGRCNPDKAAIITDETVAGLYLEGLKTSLSDAGFEVNDIIVPDGESSKSFTKLESVCRGLLQKGLGRDDIIIALGGGLVGDLAGLAASLTRRGLRIVMMPTTLLAQADSSIGGKNAINTPEGKNLIGTIRAPMMVLADTSTLETLSPDQLGNGYSEVIKHGVLEGDDPFSFLENSVEKFFAGDPDIRVETITRSIRFKSGIVEQDEKGTGVRNLLNLGHTFGHAIESASGISHGKGVAVGISMAFRFARHIGHDVTHSFQRTTALMKKASLPTSLKDAKANCSVENLLEFIVQDKKIANNKLRLIVPKGIGDIYIKELNDVKTLETFLKTKSI